MSSSQRARLEADILFASRLAAEEEGSIFIYLVIIIYFKKNNRNFTVVDLACERCKTTEFVKLHFFLFVIFSFPHTVRSQQQQQQARRSWEMDEQWRRIIRSKVEDERRRLDDEERLSASSNRDLYRLFNDLQGVSTDFGISFDVPELVVVGMQSDGKSSFIEALLGFQFNVVDSNIGTRRPLVLQMINSPSREIPSCRFRKEALALGSSEEDPFEAIETPVDQLAREIARRTNERAGSRGDRVSDVPIILRVEFAGCSSITIYDTPGWRLGGDDRLRDDIKQMVRRLIEPRHRIIVCLEQSTVESCNTVARPLVQEVDPTFSRTILINTKFDNRLKELVSASMANRYLSGEEDPALADSCKKKKAPFFISLPVRRGLSPREFRDAIREAYLDDYGRLLELGFDEKRYHTQLGMCRARAFLEQVLAERHERAVAPTLRVLDSIVRKTEAELVAVRADIASSNVQDIKAQVAEFVQEFAAATERLLEGSVLGDPDVRGQTLEEEREQSGSPEWPNFEAFDYDIPNARHRIYGGAQYERLLCELAYVTHSQEFPATSINEVASAIGAAKGHSIPVLEAAASDIVQHKSKKVLQPLLDIALARCSYIMRRMFDISLAVLTPLGSEDATAATTPVSAATVSAAAGFTRLARFDQFISQLRKVHCDFVAKTEANCRAKLRDDLDTFTALQLDWSMVNEQLLQQQAPMAAGVPPIGDGSELLDVRPEDTKQRVIAIMEGRTAPTFEGPRSRRVDDEMARRVLAMSAKLFAGTRFFFAKFIGTKMSAFFFDPMNRRLRAALLEHFRRLPDDSYEEMFQLGIASLRASEAKLEAQLHRCREAHEKFREAAGRMKASTDVFRKRFLALNPPSPPLSSH